MFISPLIAEIQLASNWPRMCSQLVPTTLNIWPQANEKAYTQISAVQSH